MASMEVPLPDNAAVRKLYIVLGSIRWFVWSIRPSSPLVVAAPLIVVCMFVCYQAD